MEWSDAMATTEEPLLHALARRIQVTVNETGRCLLTQPADLVPLKTMSPDGLRDFAAFHGWTAVIRLGGFQIEFFSVHLPRAAARLG